MTIEKVLSELKKKHFYPIYWLEGDEEFFIDQVIYYAEHQLLREDEAAFNLTIFYGRDAEWPDIINACRRYPMFAEKQVIIIKEAQAMRDINKLESYIERPLPSTLLFIAYKHKKLDGRIKMAKAIKEYGVFISTKKLYENELPEWTQKLIKSKGLSINNKALLLLIDHIGNDLSRLNNEIDKLSLNLNGKEKITEDDIEKYIGVSKEYNVFELQDALASRDIYKAMRIAQYFELNPKAGPLQLILPSLYNFFSKVLMVHAVPSGDAKTIAGALGISEWMVKNYIQTAHRYSHHSVEKALLLLHHYNLRSIGINDAGTSDGLLLKEMIVRFMND
ncbi:MAG: DNA polymerase III subunit delta [Bacteroidota bacterium]|nr:DNA polymerase III subunit delta [Bacteroidota bacterium]